MIKVTLNGSRATWDEYTGRWSSPSDKVRRTLQAHHDAFAQPSISMGDAFLTHGIAGRIWESFKEAFPEIELVELVREPRPRTVKGAIY